MQLETPPHNYGWTAPDFTLRDPDGCSFSLSDLIRENGLLIMFICNHCPYVQGTAERIAADARELQDNGIGVVAIMSNDYRYSRVNSPPFMKKFAREKGFTFPYVVDESQSIGRKYGAVCTPDFFGFNKSKELQYRGRLDNGVLGIFPSKKT